MYGHMDVGRPREPLLRRNSVELERRTDAAVKLAIDGLEEALGKRSLFS